MSRAEVTMILVSELPEDQQDPLEALDSLVLKEILSEGLPVHRVHPGLLVSAMKDGKETRDRPDLLDHPVHPPYLDLTDPHSAFLALLVPQVHLAHLVRILG